MPKIYVKGVWVDEVLAGATRYDIAQDDGTPITNDAQIALSTPVAVAGTALTADLMNNIEEGLDAVDTLLDNVVTGPQTFSAVKTFTSDPLIPDEAYSSSAWNGVLEPPTKNAVRDKIESMLISILYLDTTASLADNYTLSTVPSVYAETANAKSTTSVLTFFERFVSAQLGVTSIPAGTWSFDIYGATSSDVGSNLIKFRVSKRVAKTGMTGTFTGAGATRTFTVTGGTPFVAGDANASQLLAGLIETPTQTAWISAFTSSSVVTVTLTDPAFVNVAGVELSAIYYYLFDASTGELAGATATPYNVLSVQPAFTVTETNRLVIAFFCLNDTGTHTITLYYGGTANFTHFHTTFSLTDGASGQAEAIPNDGWIPVTWSTPTRTSATTFTVAVNVSGIIRKGYKLKLTDTTTKYFDIVSATFGAGVTTITTIANSDYALVGDPSAISWSPLDSPFGFPEWFNWTPTLTGFSANPTNQVNRYRVVGTTVFCTIRWLTGGTSNATTLTWTLPVAAKTITNMYWISSMRGFDNSALLTAAAMGFIASAATVCNCYTSFANDVWTASGTKYITIGNISYEF